MTADPKITGKPGRGGPRPKVRPNDRRGAQPGDDGQLPFVPTDEQREIVQTYAVVLSHDLLAAKMGISVSTLLRHFRKEIDKSLAEVAAEMGARIIKTARDDKHPKQTTAQIFFLRSRGVWIQTSGIVAPETHAAEVDLTNLTDEELEEYGRLAAKAEGIDIDAVVGRPTK